MCGSFLFDPLDNVGIIHRQRTVNIIEVRNWVKYHGEIMSMAEFCRRFGVDYERMRSRASGRNDLFAPLPHHEGETMKGKWKTGGSGGYTLEELSEMYSRFRDNEFATDILADLACLKRRSSDVEKLESQIQKYLENQRKEVTGK